ncbi:MAG: hypothetical protein ACE5F1_03560 [Planctomycetota bacterium]
MSRSKKDRHPTYRRHATGQAFIRIGGCNIYLGKYDTPASRVKYHETIDGLGLHAELAKHGTEHRAREERREDPEAAACVHETPLAAREHERRRRGLERARAELPQGILVARAGLAIEDEGVEPQANGNEVRAHEGDHLGVAEHARHQHALLDETRVDLARAFVAEGVRREPLGELGRSRVACRPSLVAEGHDGREDGLAVLARQRQGFLHCLDPGDRA